MRKPRAIGKYRKALYNIESMLSARMEHSRELLRDLLGDIKLTPRDHALEASLRLDWRGTLNQFEAPEISKLKVMMVAEERFIHHLKFDLPDGGRTPVY